MRLLTALLPVAAIAASALPAAASAEAPAYAGEKPYNYGTCVAYEAMFGEERVSEFTRGTDPLTAFGNADKVVGPRYPGDISIGCRPE